MLVAVAVASSACRRQTAAPRRVAKPPRELVPDQPHEPMTQVAAGGSDVFVARHAAPGIGSVFRVSPRGGFLRPVAWGWWDIEAIAASGPRACWTYLEVTASRCAPGDPVCNDLGDSALRCAPGSAVVAKDVDPRQLALAGDLLTWLDGDGDPFYAALPDPRPRRIQVGRREIEALATDGARIFWAEPDSVSSIAPGELVPHEIARFAPPADFRISVAVARGDVVWTMPDAIMRWSAATSGVSRLARATRPHELVAAGDGVAWLEARGALHFCVPGSKSRVIVAADVRSVAGDAHALYWLQNGALHAEDL